MIELRELRRNHEGAVDDWLDLPFELRCRARFRTATRSGLDAGVFVDRGLVLDEGDVLVAGAGQLIGICAAAEAVVTGHAPDWATLARACYHLGNRHVTLQVGERWLRIQPDHVLEDLIASLGLTVSHESQAFRPERGAYHGHHDHAH